LWAACTVTHANETIRQAAGDTPLLHTDEEIAHMLCDVEEKIRSNAATNATNASSKQPADKTSRIKDMHVYGLLALNPGPIDKNNSKEVLPKPVRQKMGAHMPTFPIMRPMSPFSPPFALAPAPEALSAAASTGLQAPGDSGMPSMASSPASAFSSHSVAESVEFTETNPEALHGLGLGIDAIEQKAPGDAVVNDTESEGEGEEISAGGNFALFMAQVCLFFFEIQEHLVSHYRMVLNFF